MNEKKEKNPSLFVQFRSMDNDIVEMPKSSSSCVNRCVRPAKTMRATVHVACMAYQSVGSANFHFEISGTVGLFFFILDICKARHSKQKKKKNEIMQ